ncbi:MAG TPA: BBE domain-containing protein [Streptosporangiaceae bacterium]
MTTTSAGLGSPVTEQLAAALRGELITAGQDRIKAACRDSYDRLTRVRQRYDPDNIFHVSQNIQPRGR